LATDDQQTPNNELKAPLSSRFVAHQIFSLLGHADVVTGKITVMENHVAISKMGFMLCGGRRDILFRWPTDRSRFTICYEVCASSLFCLFRFRLFCSFKIQNSKQEWRHLQFQIFRNGIRTGEGNLYTMEIPKLWRIAWMELEELLPLSVWVLSLEVRCYE
jgi:hypothetical protein